MVNTHHIMNFKFWPPLKQREVTNFAKGDNSIASLCKIMVTSLTECLVFSFSKFKVLLYKFLKYLLYSDRQV